MGCNDRPGRMEAGFRWDRREWREHGIPSRRFSPCPHCGSAVTAWERRWTPPGVREAAVFRQARCVQEGCGWHYTRIGGTRDEFVHLVNRRAKRE